MNRNTLFALIATLLVLGAVFFVLLSDSSRRDSVLSYLNLKPVPETFTELYFDDFRKLPNSVIANQDIVFTFVVSNKEGVNKVYPYRVYFSYPNGEEIDFEKGTVALNDKQLKKIEVRHKFLSSGLTGKVTVELEGRNQQIHFLLPNNNN
jgi:uncharacterized membrane protein